MVVSEPEIDGIKKWKKMPRTGSLEQSPVEARRKQRQTVEEGEAKPGNQETTCPGGAEAREAQDWTRTQRH